MRRAVCYKCKVEAGPQRVRICHMYCVVKEPDPEEAARLRDFQRLKSDGVDYSDTEHSAKEIAWARIVSGRCKCKQCEQARFAHTVKQMVAEEKKQLRRDS